MANGQCVCPSVALFVRLSLRPSITLSNIINFAYIEASSIFSDETFISFNCVNIIIFITIITVVVIIIVIILIHIFQCNTATRLICLIINTTTFIVVVVVVVVIIIIIVELFVNRCIPLTAAVLVSWYSP